MSHDSTKIRRFGLWRAPRCLLAVLLPALALTAAPVRAQAPDLEQARAEVRAADEAFARSAAARDRELFASFVAEDAVFLGGGLTQGRDAIVLDWGIFFAAAAGATITWEPHTVEVAASGDLAYTLGDYAVELVGPEGQRQKSIGTYVSIWRRYPDGSWKVVVDGGTPPKPVGVEE